MKRYAVIGQPVAHSLSPRIHLAFAKAAGLTLDYQALVIDEADLAARLSEMHSGGWAGFNVTLPHKQMVLALCEDLSDNARRAGAVNTLTLTHSGWRGDNTDGVGLIRDLERLGVALAGQRVLMLGAGGAARGIIAPLLATRPAALVISNRNPWKPESLSEAFADLGTLTPRTHWALKGDEFDVIINATSAGHSGAMTPMPDGLFADGAVAYDLSYGKAHGPFAEWAAAQGARHVYDGLGMLVEQAAESFRLWHGVAPDTAPVLAGLRNA